MTERTNQEWIDALRGPGQAAALEDLRLLLIRGLRHALTAGYGVTEADIQDFVQEALLKVLAGLDTFRGESRFTTWAHKIAVRVAFTELRRKRWEDVALQDLIAQYDEGDFTPAVLADSTLSPENRAIQRMLMETVQRVINEALTDRQRQAMVAVMKGGMPLQEVARRMGTNRNALYKLIYDARQRIRKSLVAHGLSPEEVLAAFEG